MINIQASVSKGWLNKNGGYIFDNRYYNDPLYRREQDNKINKYVREKFPRYPIYNMESNLLQARYVKENQVLVGALQPNMILAVLLGAGFSFFEDKDADTAGRPLEFISDKKELPLPESILEHSLVKDLDRQILTIKKEHPELKVIPPFFWDESGRATIHGIITTSLKLIGDNIMIMMMSDPGLTHAIHQWIADAYTILIRHFSEMAGLHVSSLHVGECAGTMISADLFEEFVVPYVSRMGEMVGPVRLHSCGFSDHILEPVSRIKNLKIIDTGSGTSIKKIRELMGTDFVVHVAPPMGLLMQGITMSEILDWLDKTLSENMDGPLQIAYHMEAHYDENNCLAIHDELERRGLITTGRLY